MHHKLGGKLYVDKLQAGFHPEPLIEEKVGAGRRQNNLVKQKILEEEKHDKGCEQCNHYPEQTVPQVFQVILEAHFFCGI